MSDRTRTVPGPLEGAVASLLATAEPAGADLAEAVVEACPRSKAGDVRADLRPALGEEGASRARCREIADELGVRPEVEGAVGIPPRVYVRADLDFLRERVTSAVLREGEGFGTSDEGEGRVALVSFSSPNANKPLHLGHLRNNAVGMALSRVLAACGWRVLRGEVVSDWGIHICQAVLAYMLWGEGTDPDEAGEKPDHLVGRFYVRFHDELARLRGDDPESAAALEEQAADLLRRMHAGDEEALRLNARVTGWAQEGIRDTYRRLGTQLDLVLREGDTLEVGTALVADALADGRCLRRPDGSVYVDLGEGMGEVTLLRADGTPVVYSQLLGFHVNRFEKHPYDLCPTLLGREWEAGANVVDEILRRWGFDWVDRIERVHYGMVRLQEGRMKSRTGTTVGADALLDRAHARLREAWEAGGAAPSGEAEREACRRLAVGVVKYLFLGVRRSKDLLYDETTLWDRALGRFAEGVRTLAWAEGTEVGSGDAPGAEQRRLLNHLNGFGASVSQACAEREPAVVVRFLDRLCGRVRACRFDLDTTVREAVAIVLRRSFDLLAIELPSSLEELPPPFAHRRPS